MIHVGEIIETGRVLRLIGILRPVRHLPCPQIGTPSFNHRAQLMTEMTEQSELAIESRTSSRDSLVVCGWSRDSLKRGLSNLLQFLPRSLEACQRRIRLLQEMLTPLLGPAE